MATTPQTNTTLERIALALKDADDIVIGGHISPDGDCLGSQLGLACALRQLGKNVTCTLASEAPLDSGLLFLPGSGELVYAGLPQRRPKTFVAVDVPTRDRLGEAQWKLHEKASLTITIDHHAVDSRMAALSYTDPDAASCSMLVWEVAKLLGVTLEGDVAACAYTGLMTDTGSFRNQNADARAFVAAAEMVAAGADAGGIASNVYQSRTIASLRLEARVVERMRFAANGGFLISYLTLKDFEETGAVMADAEQSVSLLRSLAGVRVACMLKEVEGAKGVFIKGSFRAKDDTDVREIACRHSGGGHRAAAGFKMFCPMDHAIEQLVGEFEELLGA